MSVTAHFKENAKFLLLISFVLSVLTLVTFNLQNISLGKRVLGASTKVVQDLQVEKVFWGKFLEENPSYIDGWIELGIIEQELGNVEASARAFQKAEEINPNWEAR